MFLYQEVACDSLLYCWDVVVSNNTGLLPGPGSYKLRHVSEQSLSSVDTNSDFLPRFIQSLSAANILIDKELQVTVTLINIIVSYKTNVYPTPYFDGERGIYANWHKELDIKWNVWWQTLQEQIKNGPLTKKTMLQRYCSCLTSSIIFQKGQTTSCQVQMKSLMGIQVPAFNSRREWRLRVDILFWLIRP